MPNPTPNTGGRIIMRRMGPLAVFGILFAFFFPPVGFLFGFLGYRRDKIAGERYVGWIVIMTIAVIMSIIYLSMLIMYSINPTTEDSSTYY